jgi:exonuclease III
VVQRAIKQAGPTTAYAQQWAVSRQQGIAKLEPRSQFIKDIKNAIKEWKKEGCDIILMIDAIEPMGKDSNGVNAIASKCNLIDAHVSKNIEAADTATYARGSKKIDYIMISPSLIDMITECGILPFYHEINSDHRGMYIDFDTKALL